MSIQVTTKNNQINLNLAVQLIFPYVTPLLYLGEKHFFLIRPSPGNLSLYERWMRLTTQSETFLGDMVDRWVRCHGVIALECQPIRATYW